MNVKGACNNTRCRIQLKSQTFRLSSILHFISIYSIYCIVHFNSIYYSNINVITNYLFLLGKLDSIGTQTQRDELDTMIFILWWTLDMNDLYWINILNIIYYEELRHHIFICYTEVPVYKSYLTHWWPSFNDESIFVQRTDWTLVSNSNTVRFISRNKEIHQSSTTTTKYTTT